MKRMKIIFFGGDSVSLSTLQALTGCAELAVVHPPVVKGHVSPIAEFCSRHRIQSVAVPHATKITSSFVLPRGTFDVAVVSSFRYFLPNQLLERLPRAINMHPSLLPRYRGASPIYETLRRGEKQGGASIIKIVPNELMDCGDVLAQQAIDIPLSMTVHQYMPLVCSVGAQLTVRVLEDFDSHWLDAVIQHSKQHFSSDRFHAPRLAKHPERVDVTAITADDALNTWRAFGVLGCTLNRARAPSGAKIKNPAKMKCQVLFNEAFHPAELNADIIAELRLVEERYDPGSIYFPWTSSEASPKLGCVRCRSGWFYFSKVTVGSGNPQHALDFAAALECKPGYGYPGVVCQ